MFLMKWENWEQLIVRIHTASKIKADGDVYELLIQNRSKIEDFTTSQGIIPLVSSEIFK